MRTLLNDAANRAADYLESLDNRSVVPTAAAVAALDRLGGSLPDRPTAPGDVLRLLDEAGSPATVSNAGGRYFGFESVLRVAAMG